MIGTDELIRRALGGLRVVEAAEGLRKELERTGEQDPAGLILADLMLRHAEAAERAALALRLRMFGDYRDTEIRWGDQ